MLHKHKEKSVFFCPPLEIFQVIIDVEKYPDFVPWCKAVYVKEKTDRQMIVDLFASFYGIKGNYTSKVAFLLQKGANESWIRAVSLNGIFRYLYNKWKFTPINESKTLVEFYIKFEFKSNLFSSLLNLVYEYTQNKITSAFRKRVESLAKQKLP